MPVTERYGLPVRLKAVALKRATLLLRYSRQRLEDLIAEGALTVVYVAPLEGVQTEPGAGGLRVAATTGPGPGDIRQQIAKEALHGKLRCCCAARRVSGEVV